MELWKIIALSVLGVIGISAVVGIVVISVNKWRYEIMVGRRNKFAISYPEVYSRVKNLEELVSRYVLLWDSEIYPRMSAIDDIVDSQRYMTRQEVTESNERLDKFREELHTYVKESDSIEETVKSIHQYLKDEQERNPDLSRFFTVVGGDDTDEQMHLILKYK